MPPVQAAGKVYKCGLLILTQPLTKARGGIGGLIDHIAQLVSNTLYVHLQPGHAELKQGGQSLSQLETNCLPFGTVPVTPELESFVQEFYTHGASRLPGLDIRILLSHLSNSAVGPVKYNLRQGYEIVLVDSSHWYRVFQENGKAFVDQVLKVFPRKAESFNVHVLENGESAQLSTAPGDSFSTTDDKSPSYHHVALGGTFDRLHTGHKILLGQGCIVCDRKLTVGVTTESLNQKKVLCELIQPIEERMEAVRGFLQDTKPTLDLNIVPISDPFGPTVEEADMQCLVVSQETQKGGVMVNEARKKRGFAELVQVCIHLVEDKHRSQNEEEKISSSSMRKRLLGTLLSPVLPKPGLNGQPYRIGMTGGIGSGKSSVCKRLEGLGAAVINCDLLGHQAYAVGSRCHGDIVKEFGSDIVAPSGEIDRKKLGAIVFADKERLAQLNRLVWPEIARLVAEEISRLNVDVVVLDAAVLLEAGWDAMVHEIWTTTIPRDEAVRRIMERNKLPEEEAMKRIDSQISNVERIARANVVVCTLWEYEYTQSQVEKAWKLLMERKAKLLAAHV